MKLFSHRNRTNQKPFAFFKRLNIFWVFQISEHSIYIRHNMPVTCQQAMITIKPRRFFIEVAGTNKPKMYGMVVNPLFYKTKFGMHFQVWSSYINFGAGFFKPLLPFQVGFFIK